MFERKEKDGYSSGDVTLRALELENFKAFGNRVRIPIAPITLVFGENSSGKTSIIQALQLLQQSLAHGRLTPRSEHGSVDLGSFSEFVFNHDEGKEFRVCAELSYKNEVPMPVWKKGKTSNTAWTSLELVFGAVPDSKEGRLNALLSGFGIWNQSFDIARYRRFSATKSDIPWLFEMKSALTDDLGGGSSEIVLGKCEHIVSDPIFWYPFYNNLRRDSLIEKLEAKVDDEDFDVESALDFYRCLSDDSDSVHRWIGRIREAELEEFFFLPTGKKQLELLSFGRFELPEEMFNPGHPGMTDDDDVVSPRCGQYTKDVMKDLRNCLVDLYSLGPFRKPPERFYVYSAHESANVGESGENVPNVLYEDAEVVASVNGWLNKLDIGYEIEVEKWEQSSSGLFEIRLVDKCRKDKNVRVSLTDVGFGISQILPLIVQSLVAKNQTITIEQPEVHIHPGLQANMGDLFAEAIGGSNNNRFIIETHSEHLVLRMQKLIREGTLKPEDVSVVFVSRSEEGSQVTPLPLDEDGDFTEEWPGGFFPERMNELF